MKYLLMAANIFFFRFFALFLFFPFSFSCLFIFFRRPLYVEVSETINLQITLHKFDKNKKGIAIFSSGILCTDDNLLRIDTFFSSNFLFTFFAIGKIGRALNMTNRKGKAGVDAKYWIYTGPLLSKS